MVNLDDKRCPAVVQPTDLYCLPKREFRVERVGSHELGQIKDTTEGSGRGGAYLVYVLGPLEFAVVHPPGVAQPVGLSNGPSPEPWLDRREPLDSLSLIHL